MARHKHVDIAHKPAPPPEVERKPAKKAKRTISVSTLFEQKHELRRKAERDNSSVFAPKSAGIFKPYATSRRPEHPLFQKFQGKACLATKDYRDGVGECTQEALEPIYEKLIAQIDDLAVGIDAAGGDAQPASVDTLAAEHAHLAQSLGDDKLTVQSTRADGSTIIEERQLAGTMQTFERVLAQKRGELDQLLRDLQRVEIETAAVKEDIGVVEQRDVKKLKEAFDAQIASLLAQAEESVKVTSKDVSRARKEDKKLQEEQMEKFNSFMAREFE